MPKGVPNKRYTGEFKQMVVERMRQEGLSHRETERLFELPHNRSSSWERIYLEEGMEGLYAERRGRGSKGRPPKLDKQIEEDLIAENQRLRAEVAYLKKLQALVLEDERRRRKKRG
jgi:transposase-like protein